MYFGQTQSVKPTQNIDYQGLEHSDLQYNCNPTIVADLYASWRPRLHNVISNNLGILNKQEEPYFYHNDHLGSTKLVIDGRGRICNEIDYMPFGEIFHPDRGDLEEHKFTGKERDEETNYDYFGARYYWSAAKHWLSVDPLSDKYPGISPYAYCGWNPINYIDPDGSKIVFSNNTTPEFREAFRQAVSYLRQNGLDEFVNTLERSQRTYTIDDVDLGVFTHYNIKENTIHWDPYGGVQTRLGKKLSPTTVLNHELDHASQHDKNPELFNKDANTKDLQYTNKEEKRVITTSEQRTARTLGEIGEMEVTRNDHKGTPYVTKSPITNEGY